jgi:hypothetical protein
MTPSATSMLIDDTGLEASETVRFSVDGRAYEIDLPARRATELRSMADRYIRVARKISPTPPRARRQPRPRTQLDQEQSGLIRATPEPPSASVTARAAQDEPAASASVAATEVDVHGSEHGLTDGEKQELRAIADAAKPLRTIVAGRLCTKGLADRDTAGNWWLTDAGRRELTSA